MQISRWPLKTHTKNVLLHYRISLRLVDQEKILHMQCCARGRPQKRNWWNVNKYFCIICLRFSGFHCVPLHVIVLISCAYITANSLWVIYCVRGWLAACVSIKFAKLYKIFGVIEWKLFFRALSLPLLLTRLLVEPTNTNHHHHRHHHNQPPPAPAAAAAAGQP